MSAEHRTVISPKMMLSVDLICIKSLGCPGPGVHLVRNACLHLIDGGDRYRNLFWSLPLQPITSLKLQSTFSVNCNGMA